MSRIRVLLSDDHNLVRAGLRALLADYPDIEVVGETDDGRAALELVQARRPNIVLMDIAMPGLNGLEATERIVKASVSTRVIILSMHANEEYVLQSLRVGAHGYLLKDAATEELAFAIRAVARGEHYLSPVISRRVIEEYLARQPEQADSARQRLTARQREVLQLIAEGNTTKQIAARLKVSVKTVEAHRAQLMHRLNIHDIAGLVRYALREGLVRSES